MSTSINLSSFLSCRQSGREYGGEFRCADIVPTGIYPSPSACPYQAHTYVNKEKLCNGCLPYSHENCLWRRQRPTEDTAAKLQAFNWGNQNFYICRSKQFSVQKYYSYQHYSRLFASDKYAVRIFSAVNYRQTSTVDFLANEALETYSIIKSCF